MSVPTCKLEVTDRLTGKVGDAFDGDAVEVVAFYIIRYDGLNSWHELYAKIRRIAQLSPNHALL